MLLWLRHLLDAERYTRNLKRTVVSYERLVTDWRTEADRISSSCDVSWPRQDAASEMELDWFLDESRRHQRSSAAQVGRTPIWVREVYRIFQDAAAGNPIDVDRLDAIGSEIDRADAVYGRYLAEMIHGMNDHYGRAERLKSEVAKVAGELSRAMEEAESLRQRNVELTNSEVSSEAALRARDETQTTSQAAAIHELAEARESLRIDQGRLAQVEAQRSALEQQLQALTDELNTARTELEMRLGAARAENESALGELAQVRGDSARALAEAHADNKALEEQLRELTAERERQTQLLEVALRQSDTYARELSVAQAALQEERAYVLELTGQIRSFARDTEQLSASLSAARSVADEQAAQASALRSRVEQMGAEREEFASRLSAAHEREIQGDAQRRSAASSIETLERSLVDQQALVRELSAKLNENEAELATSNSDRSKLELQLKSTILVRQQLEEAHAAADKTFLELAEQRSRIASLERELSNTVVIQRRLDEAEAVAQQRSAELSALRSSKSELEAEFSAVRAKKSQLEVELSDLSASRSQLEAEVSSAKILLSQIAGAVDAEPHADLELARSVRELRDRERNQSEVIEALTKSTSWRLTRPIRVVRRAISRTRQRLLPPPT